MDPVRLAMGCIGNRLEADHDDGFLLTPEALTRHIATAIEMAVRLERERCAAVVESYLLPGWVRTELAAAIRKGPVAGG